MTGRTRTVGEKGLGGNQTGWREIVPRQPFEFILAYVLAAAARSGG